MEFQEYICAGPAFSMVGSLDLISKTDGGRRRFFEYQEGDGYPGVRWVGNNQLIVSIGRVSDVYVRCENVKGIRIRYDIGAIGDRPGRN